jgi:hypothetical protein
VNLIEHRCPSPDCGVRLRTALSQAPRPSLGAITVTVKCPGCAINFGLWLPKSQAPYVRETALFETVASVSLADLGPPLAALRPAPSAHS